MAGAFEPFREMNRQGTAPIVIPPRPELNGELPANAIPQQSSTNNYDTGYSDGYNDAVAGKPNKTMPIGLNENPDVTQHREQQRAVPSDENMKDINLALMSAGRFS